MNQRGMALLPMVLLVGFLAFSIYAGLKIAPLYFDHFVVEDILDGVKSELEIEGDFNIRDARRAVETRLNINSLDEDIKPADFEYDRNGRQVLVSLAYQRRIHLAYNLGVYVDFTAATAIGQP